MNGPQAATIAAVIVIALGLILIGLGTRQKPPPASAQEQGDSLEFDEEQEPAYHHQAAAPLFEPTTEDLTQLAGLVGLSGPAESADDFEDPDPPLVVIETRPFVPLVTMGHESTATERDACRERMGTGLDPDLAEVTRLIESRPPELRGMLMNAPAPVVHQELAVLRAYLRGALAGLDSRLRNGPAEPGDRALAACLMSGLSRLPVHHGAVFHRAPRDDLSLDAFFPDSVLIEPTFVRADRTSFPAGGFGEGPAISYVIWSETGRLCPLFAGHADTVLFAATSRFRVLALDQQQDDATVYLAEDVDLPGERGGRRPQVLQHLREQALSAGIGPIDGPAPSPTPHPGLDDNGRPFAFSTGTTVAL
ncbi:hypothetical protein KIH74_12915 [Kineosporia sp. J2-2]|uniref:Uncharacterized protein n=1 Tax=Kineosporia corallincola TaxID=2835133 RepID=A0ABS5TFG5_9ACTN|nr:hypothetical protein [Kineosporia corallincola]MBT0769831.1 hypothetical protein [Kineosporia corallincola]